MEIGAFKGGGVRRLMANAIKHFHIFFNPSLCFGHNYSVWEFFLRKMKKNPNAKHGYEVLPHQVTFLGIIFLYLGYAMLQNQKSS